MNKQLETIRDELATLLEQHQPPALTLQGIDHLIQRLEAIHEESTAALRICTETLFAAGQYKGQYTAASEFEARLTLAVQTAKTETQIN